MKARALFALVLAFTVKLAMPTPVFAMSQARFDLAASLYRMVGATSWDANADLDVALSAWKDAGVEGLSRVTSPLDLSGKCQELDSAGGGMNPNGTQVAGDYALYQDSSGPWRVGVYITPSNLLIFDGARHQFADVAWQQLYRDDGFLGDSAPVAGRLSTTMRTVRSCRLPQEMWPAGVDVSSVSSSRIAFTDPSVVANEIDWISTHPHDTNSAPLHPMVVAAADVVAVVSSVFGWVLGKAEELSTWLRKSLGPLVWVIPPLALLTLLGTSFDGSGLFRRVSMALVMSNPITGVLFAVGESWRFSNNPLLRPMGRWLFRATYGTSSFLIEFLTGLSDSKRVLVGSVAFSLLADLTVVGKIGALIKPLSVIGRVGTVADKIPQVVSAATLPFSYARALVLVRPPAMLVVGRFATQVVSVKSWVDLVAAARKADGISSLARTADLASGFWNRSDLVGQGLYWSNAFLHSLAGAASTGIHLPQLDRVLSALSATQRQVVQHSLEQAGRTLAPYTRAVIESLEVKNGGGALATFAGGQPATIPPYGADGYQQIDLSNTR